MSSTVIHSQLPYSDKKPVFNTDSIKSGDIITFQTSNRVVPIVQSLSTISTHAQNASHVAIVVDVSEDQLTLLEAGYAPIPTLSGVSTSTYDPEQFYECYGNDIHILRRDDLQPYMERTAKQFAKQYPLGNGKIKYGMKYLPGTLLPSKDTENGRKRTLYSRAHGQFMTGHGRPRRHIICPEVVAEIVKIAQIDAITSSPVTEESALPEVIARDAKQLKEFEKAGIILDVSSKRIMPGRLEDLLVKEHDFARHEVKAIDY